MVKSNSLLVNRIFIGKTLPDDFLAIGKIGNPSFFNVKKKTLTHAPQFRSNISFCSKIHSNHDYLSELNSVHTNPRIPRSRR